MSGLAIDTESGKGSRGDNAQSESPPRRGEPAFSPGVVVLIEAVDREAAHALFRTVVVRPESAAADIIQLAPGLVFLRAQTTGKYWIFDTLRRAS